MIKKLFFVFFSAVIFFISVSPGFASSSDQPSSSQEICMEVNDDEDQEYNYLYVVPFIKKGIWFYFADKSQKGRPQDICGSKVKLLEQLYKIWNFSYFVRDLAHPNNQNEDRLNRAKEKLNNDLAEMNSSFTCVDILTGRWSDYSHELDPYESSCLIQTLNCCSMNHGLYFCPPDPVIERAKAEYRRAEATDKDGCYKCSLILCEICADNTIPCTTDLHGVISCASCLAASIETGSVLIGIAAYAFLCPIVCLGLDGIREEHLLYDSFNAKQACADKMASYCPDSCKEPTATVTHYCLDQAHRRRDYDLFLCCKSYVRGVQIHNVQLLRVPKKAICHY